MAGANNSSKRLALYRYQFFLEGDAHIAFEDGFSCAYDAVTVANGRRHMKHLMPPATLTEVNLSLAG